MLSLKTKKIITSLVLILSIGFSQIACDKDKVKTLAKASDDAAQIQISIVNLIKVAKTNNQVDDQFVSQAKSILLQINTLNGEAITLAKGLVEGPIPIDSQTELLNILARVSTLVTNLNNLGILHIKNETTKAAFNALIIGLQGAITTAVIVFSKKG